MKENEINEKVGRVLAVVRYSTVSDGIDVLSASLASAIISANATGLFEESDLKPFLNDLEKRIMEAMKSTKKTFRGIKRG